MKTIIKGLMMAAISGFLLLAVLYTFDMVFLKSKYTIKLSAGSDCQFVVPEGYKLVYSVSKKKYAISVTTQPGWYLHWYKEGDIQIMSSEITAPTVFNDSCTAKAFLKAYLANSNNDFK